jgi:hypothetical protein
VLGNGSLSNVATAAEASIGSSCDPGAPRTFTASAAGIAAAAFCVSFKANALRTLRSMPERGRGSQATELTSRSSASLTELQDSQTLMISYAAALGVLLGGWVECAFIARLPLCWSRRPLLRLFVRGELLRYALPRAGRRLRRVFEKRPLANLRSSDEARRPM